MAQTVIDAELMGDGRADLFYQRLAKKMGLGIGDVKSITMVMAVTGQVPA